MITQKVRNKFYNTFGNSFVYAPNIKRILDAENKVNRSGNPYSLQSIRDAFIGKQSNVDIEIVITKYYDIALERKQAHAKAMEEMELKASA